ncbi:MAG: GNAT family N-acetyltransferase [Chloroflexota bacterium]|nr:GNAT family N-acetyltransferase [Chloroflexota bacterium]
MKSMALSLIPAADLSLERLVLLINRVYADYFLPIWLDVDKFDDMCRVEDIELSNSVVAVWNEEPVGLGLCARRGTRGWLSGVGVLPFFRRRGIAGKMLRYLQEHAHGLQLETLTLEVLAQNQAGLALYRQLGFTQHRELLVLTQTGLAASALVTPPEITSVPSVELLSYYAAWHVASPVWQRAPQTLSQYGTDLVGLGYREGEELVGYVLYQVQCRHQAIYDLAVQPGHARRVEIGRVLLRAVHSLQPAVDCYIVNLPVAEVLLTAFQQEGYRIWQRQYEMVWTVEG